MRHRKMIVAGFGVMTGIAIGLGSVHAYRERQASAIEAVTMTVLASPVQLPDGSTGRWTWREVERRGNGVRVTGMQLQGNGSATSTVAHLDVHPARGGIQFSYEDAVIRLLAAEIRIGAGKGSIRQPNSVATGGIHDVTASRVSVTGQGIRMDVGELGLGWVSRTGIEGLDARNISIQSRRASRPMAITAANLTVDSMGRETFPRAVVVQQVNFDLSALTEGGAGMLPGAPSRSGFKELRWSASPGRGAVDWMQINLEGMGQNEGSSHLRLGLVDRGINADFSSKSQGTTIEGQVSLAGLVAPDLRYYADRGTFGRIGTQLALNGVRIQAVDLEGRGRTALREMGPVLVQMADSAVRDGLLSAEDGQRAMAWLEGRDESRIVLDGRSGTGGRLSWKVSE